MSIPFKFLSSNLKILSQFEINLHQNFAKSLLKAKTLYEKKNSINNNNNNNNPNSNSNFNNQNIFKLEEENEFNSLISLPSKENQTIIFDWFFSLNQIQKQTICSITNKWLVKILLQMCYIYFYDSSITFEPKEDLYEFYYDKNYKNDLIKPPNTLNDLNSSFDYNFYINYYDNITYDISNVYYMSRRIKDLETIEKDTLNYLRVFSFNEINDTIMFDLSFFNDNNYVKHIFLSLSDKKIFNEWILPFEKNNNNCNCNTNNNNNNNKIFNYYQPSWIKNKSKLKLGQIILAYFEQQIIINYEYYYYSNKIYENKLYEKIIKCKEKNKILEDFIINSIKNNNNDGKENKMNFFEKINFKNIKDNIIEIESKSKEMEIQRTYNNNTFLNYFKSNYYTNNKINLEDTTTDVIKNLKEKFLNNIKDFLNVLLFIPTFDVLKFYRIFYERVYVRIIELYEDKNVSDLIEESNNNKSSEKKKKRNKKKKKNNNNNENKIVIENNNKNNENNNKNNEINNKNIIENNNKNIIENNKNINENNNKNNNENNNENKEINNNKIENNEQIHENNNKNNEKNNKNNENNNENNENKKKNNENNNKNIIENYNKNNENNDKNNENNNKNIIENKEKNNDNNNKNNENNNKNKESIDNVNNKDKNKDNIDNNNKIDYEIKIIEKEFIPESQVNNNNNIININKINIINNNNEKLEKEIKIKKEEEEILEKNNNDFNKKKNKKNKKNQNKKDNFFLYNTSTKHKKKKHNNNNNNNNNELKKELDNNKEDDNNKENQNNSNKNIDSNNEINNKNKDLNNINKDNNNNDNNKLENNNNSNNNNNSEKNNNENNENNNSNTHLIKYSPLKNNITINNNNHIENTINNNNNKNNNIIIIQNFNIITPPPNYYQFPHFYPYNNNNNLLTLNNNNKNIFENYFLLSNESFFNLFSEEIITHEKKINNNNSILDKIRQEYLNNLETILYNDLKDKYNIKIIHYGSFQNNLCIEGSDIDLLINYEENNNNNDNNNNNNNDNNNNNNNFIINLLNILNKLEIEEINPIITASVPVIKLQYDISDKIDFNNFKKSFYLFEEDFMKLKFDLTFTTKNIFFYNETLDYVKNSLNKYKNLRPIFLFLKRYFKVIKLNKSYLGGLSSYSLFLMSLAFIKNKNDNKKLGLLLYLLLDFYSKFNFKNFVINVESQIIYNNINNIEDYDNIIEDHIKILDPITKNNVAKSSFKDIEIKNAFLSAKNKIKINIYQFEQNKINNNNNINNISNEIEEENEMKIIRTLFDL